MIYLLTTDLSPETQEFIAWLYRTHAKLMYATALKYVPDKMAAEDVVHDSLIKLIRYATLLQTLEDAPLAGYIITAVRNTAINWMKAQKVREKHTGASLEETEFRKKEELSVTLEDLAILSEQKNELKHALDKLSETDRLLLEGKYIWLYSDAELAHLIGCKPNSIRMKLTRARRRAFQIMKEMEESLK